MTTIAAHLAIIILTGLAIFQAGLIAGRPWGRFAWGGQHAVLPRNLRFASVTSVILYIGFAASIAAAAGLLETDWDMQPVMRIMTAYFALGVILNAVSRSRAERTVMTPAAAALTLLFGTVALTI